MNDDILTDIIAVEKEIRERLDAEREHAAAWLAEVRTGLEEGYRREEERLREELERALAAARSEAELESARLVAEATAQADRLTGIEDETLLQALDKHLVGLRPGDGDDRQNDES